MKAIIFNSGLGSRMLELTKDKPKCMVPLYNGETIFERQIRILSSCGIEEFIVTTGPYKEQLYAIAAKYENLTFHFCDNPRYKETNYIVSMDNAYDLLDDDVLLLHGDLVFNRGLVMKMLESSYPSIGLYNEEKQLPEKDFKGRFIDNKLKEVSISIFDEDCYTFQPLYKLSKDDLFKWKNQVRRFVKDGIVNVYAENALNTITDTTSIYGMSYKDDFIEEIDNQEDYVRVNDGIQYFDYEEQRVIVSDDYIETLKTLVCPAENIFIVTAPNFVEGLQKGLQGYNLTIFTDFSSNPKYEEVLAGVNLFKEKKYTKIVSMGGGSAIDVAKCIKMFVNLENPLDFLEKKYVYNNLMHIAIPTTAGTGSESTQFAVMYYKGEKQSIDHGSVLPGCVILDASLLVSLPMYQKKATLLDALSQGIESYWAKGANRYSHPHSVKAITLILENYQGYLAGDLECSKKIIAAANQAGKAINISRTTAAHALSYKVTSLYNAAHGHAVALCLVPVWRLLADKAGQDENLAKTLEEIAGLFNVGSIEESIDKYEEIFKSFDLFKVEIKEEDIETLVNSVNVARLNNNPVLLTKEEIEAVYRSI